jgi:hypothetical protein
LAENTKNWHSESFQQKTDIYFFLIQAERHPTKKLQGCQIFNFHDFSIMLSFITQRGIEKACAWVRWKGILLNKIQKIKKPTTTICVILKI